jgi:methylated-DNA-[protein]-cysteine S-methyltransferase
VAQNGAVTAARCTLFGTAIGRCGIAWTDAGIVAVQIPEASDDATLARLRHGLDATYDDDPPPPVRRAVDGITALLTGAVDDLADVVLDDAKVGEFDRRVYAAARLIPQGETATYGEIADRIGAPGQARAVGKALGRNPFPLVVPCHRVVGADGRLVGFSAGSGVATKVRILALEGATVSRTPSLFDADALLGELS